MRACDDISCTYYTLIARSYLYWRDEPVQFSCGLLVSHATLFGSEYKEGAPAVLHS